MVLKKCFFLNTDCTNARVNGKSAHVFVCSFAGEQRVLYFAREKKGHEGVKDTVVENYQGITVRTFMMLL